MASITQKEFDRLTFELYADQIFALNRVLGETQFRFIPHSDASKNLEKIKKISKLYEPAEKGGKTGSGEQRPTERIREAQANISQPQVKPTFVPAMVGSNDEKEKCKDLLDRLKSIVKRDFPQVSSSFDSEMLERGILKGYFLTLSEFETAAKQVIRAMSNKYKNLDFTRK